jgi:hypothetical protein
MQTKPDKEFQTTLKITQKKLGLKKDTIRQLRNAQFDGGGEFLTGTVCNSCIHTFCGNCTGTVIC